MGSYDSRTHPLCLLLSVASAIATIGCGASPGRDGASETASSRGEGIEETNGAHGRARGETLEALNDAPRAPLTATDVPAWLRESDGGEALPPQAIRRYGSKRLRLGDTSRSVQLSFTAGGLRARQGLRVTAVLNRNVLIGPPALRRPGPSRGPRHRSRHERRRRLRRVGV